MMIDIGDEIDKLQGLSEIEKVRGRLWETIVNNYLSIFN